MPEVRLIDANALAESDIAKIIDNYLYNQCNLTVGFAAALMPEIEADPVRHGRWIETRYNPVGDTMYCDCNCSNCNFEITREKGRYPKFCENCGTRMDGGSDND